MKRLKAGAVNSISFIRNISYTTNSFDVEFEKVVGTTALTLSGIEDQLGLADCSDFIVLNIDLISNELDGGEYYMTITNGSNSSTYLCEVQSYRYNTHGTSIYADSVVLSTDLTGATVENDEAVTDSEGGTTSGGSGTGSSGTVTISMIESNYQINGELFIPVNYNPVVHIDIQGTSTNIDHLIEAEFTDTSGNTEVFSNTQRTNVVFSFDMSNAQTLNFGDVADVVFRVKTTAGVLLGTSPTYVALIPPRIKTALGLTAAEAQSRIDNVEHVIEIGRNQSDEPPQLMPDIPLPQDYYLWINVLDNHSSKIMLSNEGVNVIGHANSPHRNSLTALTEHTYSALNTLEKFTYVAPNNGGTFTQPWSLYELENSFQRPASSQQARFYNLTFEWVRNGVTYETPKRALGANDSTYVPYQAVCYVRTARVSKYENYQTAYDGGMLDINGAMPIVYKGAEVENDSLWLFLGGHYQGLNDITKNRFKKLYIEVSQGLTSYYKTVGPNHADVTLADNAYTGQVNGQLPPVSAMWIRVNNLSQVANTPIAYVRVWIEYNTGTYATIHNIDNGTGFAPQFHLIP